MAEICIEIDEEIMKRLNEILSSMGLTLEVVVVQFIRFCADSYNAFAVSMLFDKWIHKEEGM